MKTIEKMAEALKDVLNCYWDMSPLEFAASKGLTSISDEIGVQILDEARKALQAYESEKKEKFPEINTLEEAISAALDEGFTSVKAAKIMAEALSVKDVSAQKIFSGDYSRDMWDAINVLDATSTGDDTREVLYMIGCRLQEFESKVDRGQDGE